MINKSNWFEITNENQIESEVHLHVREYLSQNPLSQIVDLDNEPISIKRYVLERELYIEFDSRFLEQIPTPAEEIAL